MAAADAPTLVERVARALCVVNEVDPDQLWNVERPEPHWMLYVSDARAAIAAMREPTAAMIQAGFDAPFQADGPQREQERVDYTAMIDAALNEGSP